MMYVTRGATCGLRSKRFLENNHKLTKRELAASIGKNCQHCGRTLNLTDRKSKLE